MIFTYKQTAEVLAGRKLSGNGFIPGFTVAGIEAFVMPGPYEANATASPTLRALGERLGSKPSAPSN